MTLPCPHVSHLPAPPSRTAATAVPAAEITAPPPLLTVLTVLVHNKVLCLCDCRVLSCTNDARMRGRHSGDVWTRGAIGFPVSRVPSACCVLGFSLRASYRVGRSSHVRTC